MLQQTILHEVPPGSPLSGVRWWGWPDGEPLAQALYFRFSGADLLYLSTYQPTAARYSPSHLLLARAAQMAAADGVRILELGRGDEPYKFRLGAQPRYLRNVAVAPVP